MNKGIFIKHKAYKDVCCLVLKSFETDTKYKLKIQWWNQGFVNSWNMNYTQNIVVTKDDLKNWLWTSDKIDCLRNANWKTL